MVDFDFITDCVNATQQTYEKMLGDIPAVNSPVITKSGIISVREITALIGFNGVVIGSMLISMNEEEAKRSISRFLGYEITEVDDDLLDGIEEIVNIIAGSAAARFPVKTGLGLPTVLMGSRQRIHGNTDSPWALTTMKSEALGEFTIGATLKEV
jgi:chemotaxis protein CheX